MRAIYSSMVQHKMVVAMTKKTPIDFVSNSMVLVCLLLGACTAAGPDYVRPAVELPQAWPGSSATGGVAVDSHASATDTSPWWKIYADPTLDTLIEEAFTNNTDIALAAARMAEVEAQTGLVSSQQMPSLLVQAGSNRSSLSQSTAKFQPIIPITSTNNRVALVASFELDFWGRYRRSSEAARATLLATEAARDTVQVALAVQITQAYFNLLALDAHVETAQRSIARSRESMSLQQLRYKAGVISEFELRQREAELEAFVAQLPPLQRRLSAAETALAVMLGRSPREVMQPKIPRGNKLASVSVSVGEKTDAATAMSSAMPSAILDTLSKPLNLPAGLPSDLLLSRPDLREAEQRLIATNALIGAARAAYFPQITLTGSLGNESASLADLFGGPARIWQFAGTATQALWGGGRLTYQTKAAEARNQQALAQYRQAIANAFREVQDAIVAQTRLREVYEAETRRVHALKRGFELATLRYRNGVSSQLEVIDQERNLLATEQNRIAAERDLRNAIANFYRALGAGASVAKSS
ncbi:MAG: TolC family protein [Candidatus Nitrotoga sp.]